MSARSVALAIAAIAVLAGGVYLFVQVRANPAQAQVPPPGNAPAPSAPAPAVAGSQQAMGSAPEKPWDPGPYGTVRPPIVTPETLHASPEHTAELVGPSDDKPNPNLDSVMKEAHVEYDQHNYAEARQIAAKVLAKQPNNANMLRVMVSSSCFLDDAPTAQQYYSKLTSPQDRKDMKKRCDEQAAITLTDPPQ